MSLALNLLPTAVGSLPHSDPVAACDLILRVLPEIPIWPQLPRRTFRENMYAQYGECFPGVVLDEAGERIWVDRSQDLTPALEHLYAAYLENDLDFAAISPEYAAGLYTLLRRQGIRKSGNQEISKLTNQQISKSAIANRKSQIANRKSAICNLGRARPPASGQSAMAIKGQVTGPISWGLTVTDENRRPVLYDEVLADAVAKHLRLKAAWQERELRKLVPQTIIFVDEPYMSAYGSAFVAIDRDLVVSLLSETMAGIQGLVGVHCCGNTDWSILLETPMDILNFDAYGYAESLALYPQAVHAFLRRGGAIAWGIVPALEEEAIWRESVASLTERLVAAMHLLVKKGLPLDDLLAACLVTTSCGLRGRTEAAAERALELVAGVSREMRRRYGGTGN
jgi:methionine synthase II (cobalamin-independent)